MASRLLTMTHIGGPTALLEVAGLRFLTDPTFDPAGGTYTAGPVTLRKLAGPAAAPDALGRIDVVLLSHDHHFDNLDRVGRAMLDRAGLVLTTVSGAERLGGQARGLAAWQTVDVPTGNGGVMHITGTPARHGPVGGDRGPVTGFVLAVDGHADDMIYVSGDTVWYEGVAEVARRFPIGTAILFMGAARIREVGPDHVTMTVADGIEAARAMRNATIVPLHCEGWAHFTESRAIITRGFSEAGMEARLRWLKAGVPTVVDGPDGGAGDSSINATTGARALRSRSSTG